MTTIIGTQEALYSDSQCNSDGATYLTPKLKRLGGSIVGFAGDCSAGQKFIDWFMAEGKIPKPKYTKDEDLSVFVLNKDGLFLWTEIDGPDKVLSPYHAIGSGGIMAITALHLGNKPEDALKIACELDPNSSLPIQTEKL